MPRKGGKRVESSSTSRRRDPKTSKSHPAGHPTPVAAPPTALPSVKLPPLRKILTEDDWKALREECISRLRSLQTHAIDSLEALLYCSDPKVRLQAVALAMEKVGLHGVESQNGGPPVPVGGGQAVLNLFMSLGQRVGVPERVVSGLETVHGQLRRVGGTAGDLNPDVLGAMDDDFAIR